MKRLAPWAIAIAALWVLFVYYAFEVLFNGAFAVPVRHAWKVPAPSGTVVVRGAYEIGLGAEDSRFEATYHPANGSPDEPVGTWRSETWNPVAYRVGVAIVFLPDGTHPFVRTARGRWTALPIDANMIVRHVSPETREIIVDRQGAGGALQARLFMQLSMDGEQLTLTRTQDAQASARLP